VFLKGPNYEAIDGPDILSCNSELAIAHALYAYDAADAIAGASRNDGDGVFTNQAVYLQKLDDRLAL
jgi:hypothetical protein